MAVTAIWRVKGRLDKVINYAENPEKTTMFENNGLSSLIRYAVNSDKTEAIDDESIEVVKSFVSGVNCFPSTAIDEMIAVKMHFGKTEGVIAYHGYQSFAPGEVTPEIAHEIGIKLAEKLWGERYQVVVATHLDKANHLHNHFVVNNVSFIDGIKYHRTGKDYREMWTASVFTFETAYRNRSSFLDMYSWSRSFRCYGFLFLSRNDGGKISCQLYKNGNFRTSCAPF